MRPIHTNLPAPAGGMLQAKRPTGIVMGLVVTLLAMIAMSVFQLLEVIPAIVEAVSNRQPFDTEAMMSFSPYSLIAFAGALLVFWLWLRFKERRPFVSLGLEARSATGQSALRVAVRGYLIGLGLLAICVLVPVIAGQAQLTWNAPGLASVGMICAILIGFLVQGSVEEIITRGYLTQVVARRWGLVAAIIIQAVFFAAIHGGNPGIGVLPFINLLLFAVFASFMSFSDGSLWGVCAMHGAWNWAQGNLFGVAVSGVALPDSLFGYTVNQGSADLLTGGAFGIEGSLVTTVVYLIGSVIYWRIWQQRRATERTASREFAIGV